MRTILHAIQSLEGGGAERQLAMLACEQVRRGWNVHLALRRSGVYGADVAARGVCVHQLGDLRKGHPLLFARVAKTIRATCPDLVQTWLPQMDIVAGSVAASLGIPWFLSERSTADSYRSQVGQEFVRRTVARTSAGVLANSKHGADYWRRALAGTRVRQVDNAVDISAIREAPPLDASNAFLCVGRYVSTKGQAVLVQAIARVPAANAILIGEGSCRDEIVESVQRLGLVNRVRVFPFRKDWWGFLKSAIAFVSMSEIEGTPNALLEAAASGCPLIVSDIPAHRAILPEEAATFVPPGDFTTLAGALTRQLAEPEERRKQRGQRARQAVERRTIVRVADQYERAYSELG